MKYNNFEMYLYDDKNDAFHKNDLLNNSVSLEKFLISYEVSSIPTIELILSTVNGDDYLNIKQFYAIITNDTYKLEYKIGVINSLFREPNQVTIHGFLCTYDNIHQINSSYLGGSFLECIRSLNIRDKVKINDLDGFDQDFTDDFSIDYWKIQESDIQATDKLLKMAFPKSIYSMDNDNIYINTIDFGNEKYKYNIVEPDEILYISKSDKLGIYTDINNSENKTVINRDDALSGLCYGTSLGRSIISNNNTSLINYTTSLPYQIYIGDFLIKAVYKKIIMPMIIGYSMKGIPLNIKTNSNWYIIGKVEKYSIYGIETAILFSCK